MKVWIKVSSLLMISLLVTNLLKAQVVPDVTPDNIAEVVDELFAVHGSQIEIDYDSLYQFIDDLLPNSSTDAAYDPLTPPPTASLDSITNDSMFHSWPAVPSAHSYQASFIKLSASVGPNIEHGSIQTTGTESGFDVSNGLVLVVLQSKRSRGKIGKGNVVIVDKPVFFEHINEGDCSCEFEGPTETNYFGTSTGLETNDGIQVDYTHNGPAGYYNTTVEYSDGTVASVLIRVEILENGTVVVGEVCSEGVFHQAGGSVMYTESARGGEDPRAASGVISFSNGIGFEPRGETSGSVTVTECLTEDDGDTEEGNSPFSFTGDSRLLEVRPNPARNYINLTMPVSTLSEKRNYFLVDSAGKQMMVPASQLTAQGRNIRLDIRSLPLGTYLLVVQDKNEVLKTRFIKLE